ncbi:MAG: GDSL-type esterase/lipase family protein [Candidatus Krumholzibacteria bacterium]|nr:GDSL-type esterase/lipase family protein [Candidatus Krumholzibacteria bacterium]MDH4335932.1 GDSL-type esterase/lipase family protein [Candidatus Krumholzibacteria bacterium]MDH5268492.1 GDSL-type esterase/lipase family protein [Candidatus Krumholzibacteria bacterium]
MPGTGPFWPRLRRFVKDAAVSAAVAMVALLVCEGLLRALNPQVPRTENLSAFSRAVPDSVLGHRYRPGASSVYHSPEFTVRYEIGADGRRLFPQPEADSAAVRILVLGDSFTFGCATDAPYVWTEVMQQALRARGLDVVVVNAGVEGYDTRAELHYLSRILSEVRPDLVLLGFLANDVYTNTPLDAPAPQSMREHRGRRGGLHTLALARRLLMGNDRAYARLFMLTSRREYYATPPDENVQRQIQLTAQLLGEMNAYCEVRNTGFAVVSIPQQFAVLTIAHGYHFEGIDPTVIDARLGAVAAENGFPWIDVLPALVADYRANGEDLYFRVDGHFTRRGNRLAGEACADALAPMLRAGEGELR